MNKSYLLGIAILVTLSSCKKDDEPTDNTPTYDKTEMLQYFSDSLITFQYKGANATASLLDEFVTQLRTNPGTQVIGDFRDQFDRAYKWWQHVAHLEFGPALDVSLRGNVNVYPTDTIQINNNINAGTYDLSTADNTDAKGLPAIGYLLYGTGDTEEEVQQYLIDNPTTLDYLEDLIIDYQNKVNQTYQAWTADNNSFINSKGSDAGSSTSMLYNSLVSHTERYFRDGKIGIPAGKRTLGQTLPNKTENFYKGESIPLAIANIESIHRFFKPGENQTFYHYLATLKAQYNGQLLADAVNTQFITAIDKLKQIPDPLSATVDNNLPVIDAAYVEIQKLIVMLKTDVPSALGVLINYQDNDGD